jgi:hypothetical protein
MSEDKRILRLKATLAFGSKLILPIGDYEGDNIPEDLEKEFELGSPHIEEVIVRAARPKEVVAEEKPKEVVAEEKPKEVVAEEKPKEVVAEEKPKEVVAEEKPAEVVAEKKPADVVVKRPVSGKK